MIGIKDIIFLWDSEMGTENKNGVVLSGRYRINYCKDRNCLSIRKNEGYVDNFWGGNIHNCFAIVGENGAGKTMLVNCIMNNIKNMKSNLAPRNDFIVMFEGQNYDNLILYYTESIKEPQIFLAEGISCEAKVLGNTSIPQLKGVEFAYFHNALSARDYFREIDYKYDFSLGNKIQKFGDITYEMKYDNLQKDRIRNYYDNEDFRIIEFLYDYVMYDKAGINFPLPKQISIQIADGANREEYITEEIKKMNADGADFLKAVNNLVVVFGRTWINNSIKNLILNCFKELCIPSTTPSNLSENLEIFFGACRFMGDKEKIQKSVYSCAYKIIDNIKELVRKELGEDYLDNIRQYVNWLENNETKIKHYQQGLRLCVSVDYSTRTFMSELLNHYSKISFAFPFYAFSFGVSTGEYNFLSIFSDLYSMVKRENSGINVYNYSVLDENTNSLLLIFDEADLSMHPMWQRMFIKWITDFCKELFCRMSVKIIVTTHSPILLSDFPHNSVLYLEKNKAGTYTGYIGERKTFASNIHSLFLHSFFLDEHGTMGAFAEEKINTIMEQLFGNQTISANVEEVEKVIDCIGEEIIKDKLMIEVDRYKGNKDTYREVNSEEVKIIDDTLKKLNMQREYLDQLIKELEDKIR